MKKLTFKDIIDSNEKITFLILLAWCFLPAIMTLIVFFYYLTNQLPTVETLIKEGLYGLNFYYNISKDTYISLFNILGIITFIHVMFTMIVDYKSIFSKDNVKKKPWYYLIFIFAIWALIACLISENPFESFIGSGSLNAGFRTDLVYVFIFFLATFLQDEKKRMILIKLFGLVVIYISILMIIRENGNEVLAYCFPQWRAVVFCQFNHFGYVLCMAIMSFVGLYLYNDKVKIYEKIYYLLGCGFLTYSLLVNDTFGSYLATVVCLPIIYIIYLIRNRHFPFKCLLPLIVFVAVSTINYTYNVNGNSTLYTNLSTFTNDLGNVISNNTESAQAGTGRMTLWRDTIQRIKDKPLFGYGELGLSGKYAITNNDCPHNEFLGISAYFGIPALLLYLSILFSIAINKFKNLNEQPIGVMIPSCLVFVYLASSFFGNALFTSYPFYMMFLGLTVNDSLVNPNYEIVKENFSKKEGPKKLLIVCLSIVLIATLIGFVGMKKLKNQTEYNDELADLELMEIAHNFALYLYKQETIEANTTYLFDATDYSICKNDALISAYGRGTNRSGNALNTFEKDNNYSFDYNESMDYTDKIIELIVKIVDEKPIVELNWINAK